jgi:predicted RNA binding protein YcfA (HicA-like mRNA interferase family)
MSHWQKTLEKVMAGNSDGNVRYDDLCSLLEKFGYVPRQTGSHRTFKKAQLAPITLVEHRGTVQRYMVRLVREELKKQILP